MKFLSLGEQADILKAALDVVFGTGRDGTGSIDIEITDHPDPLEDLNAPQDAIRIDKIFTLSCGEHLITEDGFEGAAFSYLLEVDVYLPSTHDHPPDWDVVDLGAFKDFYECVRFLVNHMVADRLDCAFQNVAINELATEVAEESTCKSSGSE